VIVICAFPIALWFWQTPDWGDIVWFLAAGLAGTLGHLCQQRGYQLADITLLQPIGFLSLIWNTMLGYFLFFQSPDVWTFVGAAVIFASAMYISHREAVRKAQIKTATAQANPQA
jgi:drug/metabolite transporter (DMT)-like permease